MGDAQTAAGLQRRGIAPYRNDNGGQPTLGLRLLGLARRLGPRPASLRPACRRI